MTNTSIAVAELLQSLGHQVTLLNLKGTNPWWDDCQQLQKLFHVAHLDTMDPSGNSPGPVPYDLIFEIGVLTLRAAHRARLTKAAVWIVRKPFVLTEIESSIYPTLTPTREPAGLTEAWLLDDVTSPDDVAALELLAGCPVRRVPFLWTPLLAEAHLRSIGSPAWSADPAAPLHVHMVDTNTSSISSSVLPLVILREAARRKVPFAPWKLHNGEMIAKSRFFRENVLNHCSDFDLSGACVGRQRCVEWATQPNSIGLCHIRFLRIRPVLLDLTWAGIPTIHNSPALRDIGHGLQDLYYHDNGVDEGARAFERLVSRLRETNGGWFQQEASTRREGILRAWSPASPRIRASWTGAIQGLGISAAATVAAPAAVSPGPVLPPAPVSTPAPALVPAANKTNYRVVFSDMHDQFQADINFFILLLNAAGATMNPPITVTGHDAATWTSDHGPPDLVLFGPFGEAWRRFPASVPKAFYSGENSVPIKDTDVHLNMTHAHVDMVRDNFHIRVPHWMISINWFGADPDRLVNPKPIPLEAVTRTYEGTLASRDKFCAFVVTNPRNPVRNQAFQWLSQYKPVDSAGRVFNTLGEGLFAGLGGGGGELRKMRFLQSYKFCLAYENEAASGYTTEKYLHAKAAGCIPIYWGDPDFQRDFDPAGCIDARKFRSPEDLINAVRAIDSDPEAWRRLASVPAMDAYRVELARRTLSQVATKLFQILGVDAQRLSTIPRFLGAAPGSPEAQVGLEEVLTPLRLEAPPPPAPTRTTTVAPSPLGRIVTVTYSTHKYLGSLQHWLVGVEAQMKVLSSVEAIVFLGPDVSEDTLATLKQRHPSITYERPPTDWTPPDFPDFWEPTHFGWKLWLYHHLVHRTDLSGATIFYTDAGAMLVRWPAKWMQVAREEGVCCLEDPREENDRWCGDTFCERLSVTDAERAAKQVAGGLICFVGGHPRAVTFFDEAFRLAQVRDILVGPHCSGQTVDGKFYGHRQDQSILSILVRRQSIPLEPLDSVYCDHSMRKTFTSGRSLYVHRGNFNRTIPFLAGIDDAFVINLDRRADRLTKFWATHPGLEDRVTRWRATDGRALTLSPALAQLFAPNDFFWKKAVMGCATSHLGLWWKLANEHPDIQNYLIFEDDAKMLPDWEETLEKSMAHVPEDYDVLYLGGILPPNRDVFQQVLKPVTKYYSRIQPNTIFGQPHPTPYFHSCAYAYILSRRGAIKIMEGLQAHKGYWTSADHILCSPCETMNLYFLTPPVAGCYQDDDPVYAKSEFNNFSRVDSFDSDLWNNDERFSKQEIEACAATPAVEPFNLALLLRQVFAPAAVASATTVSTVSQPPTQPQPQPTLTGAITVQAKHQLPARFVSVHGHTLDFSKVYERDWLFSLFGGITTAEIQELPVDAPPPSDCPIVILQRPHVLTATRLLERWSAAGATFRILHLSDEFSAPQARDPLAAYTLPGCVSVLRTYLREDLPPGTEQKVKIVPLGYRWSPIQTAKGHTPLTNTPNLPFRELHWSFAGTDWAGRREQMKPLLDAKLLSNHRFFATWNDPNNLSRDAYLAEMMNSIFIPCPGGVNPETFRFYEALECGSIPLVLKTPENETWFRWVSQYIPLLSISTWDEVVQVMIRLLTKPETMEIYRRQLLTGWVAWCNMLRAQGQQWLLQV